MKEAYDSGHLEALEECIRSEGYKLIAKRIQATAQAKFRDLVRPVPPQESDILRGAIAGLELALEVPDILVREIKSMLPKVKQ